MDDINIINMKQVLVATFVDRRNANEFKRLLEIGVVYNSLDSNKGRIVETKEGIFNLYAIK